MTPVWTTNPPTEPGWYWVYGQVSDCSECAIRVTASCIRNQHLYHPLLGMDIYFDQVTRWAKIPDPIEPGTPVFGVWQSIESAPKDGTPVLLCRWGMRSFKETVGWWSDQDQCWMSDEPNPVRLKPHPHWMPLPASPEVVLIEKDAPTCKHCNIPLVEGEALIPTVVVHEDFPGQGPSEGSTCGFGPGKLKPCLKCPQCGYSVSK